MDRREREDEDDDDDDWIVRTDPNGKKYYENVKSRRAIWTDRSQKSSRSRPVPPPPPDVAASSFNPTREEQEEVVSVPKNGLERARSNTRGHSNVPVLSKKAPLPPPPPPNPPPVGWSRAVDYKNREYFWEVATGKTVWKREDCK
jgi:hypothetical protein